MVKVATDDRETWIRLSVGPNIESSEFIKDMVTSYQGSINET